MSVEITILIMIIFCRSQDSGFSDSGDDQTDIIEEITNRIDGLDNLEQDESNANLDKGTHHDSYHDSQNKGSHDTGSEIIEDTKIENEESEKDVLGEIVPNDLKDDVNEDNNDEDDSNEVVGHEFRILNINENEYEKVFK